MKFLLPITALLSLIPSTHSLTPCKQGKIQKAINFDNFAHNTYLTLLPDEGIAIDANTRNGGYTEQGPRIYNTINGEDTDLEGPGRPVLIVQESNTPEADDNAGGGFITFKFPETVEFQYIDVVDSAPRVPNQYSRFLC